MRYAIDMELSVVVVLHTGWLLIFFLSYFIGWQNFDARLSDFGLAKDGPTGGKSHVSTRIMGTYGYAAPEYMATGISSLCYFADFVSIFRLRNRDMSLLALGHMHYLIPKVSARPNF